jgi:iron complex transport system substrate-binding protein
MYASAPPAADVTRRRFLGGAAAAGLSLGLAACGGSSNTTTSTTAATRTVATPKGAVRVPARPSRIVAINDYALYTLLDLGIEPVGIYSAGEEYVPPVYLERFKQLPVINEKKVAGQLSVEKILELRPDLIIGIDAQDAPYGQLSHVAPTVLLPFNANNGAWRPLARVLAAAVGREDDLRALDAQWRQRGVKVRQDHAQQLGEWSFDLLQGGFDQGKFWVYGTRSNIYDILAPSGIRLASASGKSVEQDVLSYENVSRLKDADALFYYATSDGKPANFGPELFKLKSFGLLPAVQNERMIGSVNFLPTSYGSAVAGLEDLAAGLARIAA